MTPFVGPPVGLLVYLVYFKYDDVPKHFAGCAEPLVAALRSTEDIDHVVPSCLPNGHTGRPDWEVHHLHGADEPYSEWDGIDQLFVVSYGGIGDGIGNTEHEPSGLGVFVDRSSAVRYAERNRDPNVVVRTVKVGELLEIQD